jgi:hypothetical protein
MDPATLAATAIVAALPYLVAFGKEAAKGAAGEVGKNVWTWVKSKLSSPLAQQAVGELEKDPNDDDNRKLAEVALAKFLKSDDKALSELAKLLENAGVKTSGQVAHVVGDENIVSQLAGSGNTSTINKGASAKKDRKQSGR